MAPKVSQNPGFISKNQLRLTTEQNVKTLVKQRFGASEKLIKYLITPIDFDSFKQKPQIWSQNYKSIRLIHKTYIGSRHVETPYKTCRNECFWMPLFAPLDAFGVPPIPIRTSGYMNCYKDCPAGGGLIRLKLLSRIPSPVREATPTHWVATQPPPYCWEI